MRPQPFGRVWPAHLDDVLMRGRRVAPRGRMTMELAQHTVEVDMRRPVLVCPTRKPSYGFMAAEAYWILTGDDRVDGVAPWNKNIAQFSDDGERFFGAYGPKVVAQLPYVVAALRKDPDTRQAGLTIWRESPPPTKDVPCTVAMFFARRLTEDGRPVLNAHVFMRSNDVWLGTPYDVFNFSMVAHLVCLRLRDGGEGWAVTPGTLYLTAASSHLYEENWQGAMDVMSKDAHEMGGQDQPLTPLWHTEEDMMVTLRELRDAKAGSPLRWWEDKR